MKVARKGEPWLPSCPLERSGTLGAGSDHCGGEVSELYLFYFPSFVVVSSCVLEEAPYLFTT